MDQVIDFETIPSHQYTFTITAADATNSATDDLTIDIIGQNEPFTFDQAGYGVSAPEGQVGGKIKYIKMHGYISMFSTIFTKGHNFSEFLLAFLGNATLPKQVKS